MPDRHPPEPESVPPAEQEAGPTPELKWGIGRVAFFACLDEIKDEIRQGWPLTVIHARHRGKLHVSYSGFRKLVGRHAADARIASSPPRDSAGQDAAVSSPPARPRDGAGRIEDAIPAGPSPETPMEGAPPHAGQQPAQTFTHDPVERPGDYERLLGTRRR
jgi:hypothetical protein